MHSHSRNKRCRNNRLLKFAYCCVLPHFCAIYLFLARSRSFLSLPLSPPLSSLLLVCIYVAHELGAFAFAPFYCCLSIIAKLFRGCFERFACSANRMTRSGRIVRKYLGRRDWTVESGTCTGAWRMRNRQTNAEDKKLRMRKGHTHAQADRHKCF